MYDTVQNVNCGMFLYGDDSALLVSGKSQTEIERTLNLDLKSLCGWIEENKFSRNLWKIKSLLFASTIRLAEGDSMYISFNGVNLETKLMANQLGNIVDQDMIGSFKGKCAICGKLKCLHKNKLSLDNRTNMIVGTI